MIDRFTESELRQLTDVEPPFTGQINTPRLQRAMDSANSRVDAALATRFKVPVDPAPEILIEIAADFARYRLAVGAARLTERDKEMYEDSKKTLDKIAEGRMSIGLTPLGTTPAAASANDVIIVARPNDFAKGNW